MPQERAEKRIDQLPHFFAFNDDSKIPAEQSSTAGYILGSQLKQYASGGYPMPISLSSEMTDQSTVYIYIGEETGYNYGYLYAYVDGGWTNIGLYGRGQDGISPVATVTQTQIGARVVVTDKNGTTTADIANGTATDAQVNAWLDTHPEATTTVEDGSITIAKLSNDVIDSLGVFYKYTNVEFNVNQGYSLRWTDGVHLNASNLYTTDKIYVEKLSNHIVINFSEAYTANSSSGLCFYDVNNKWISGKKLYDAGKKVVVDVPENASYFMASIQSPSTTIGVTYFENTGDIDTAAGKLFNLANENSEGIANIITPTKEYYRDDVNFPKNALWDNRAVSVGDTLPRKFSVGSQPEQYFAHRGQIHSGDSISFIGTNQPANTALNVGMVVTDKDLVVTEKISYANLKNTTYTFEEDGYFYVSYACTDETLPLFKILNKIDFLNIAESVNNIQSTITEELSTQPVDLITREFLLHGISKVICVGDSVTQGVLIGASGTEKQQKLCYPTQLAKMTGWAIENGGSAGATTLDWWQDSFGKYNYVDYEVGLIELGYNGGLTDTVDEDTTGESYDDYADTNTGGYCKIIEGMKAQNSEIFIVLIISPGFSDSTANVVIKIAEKYSLPYIDLRDTSYVDLLNDNKYHCTADGTVVSDKTHMNALGYLTKAEFIRSELIQILTNHYTELNRIMINS